MIPKKSEVAAYLAEKARVSGTIPRIHVQLKALECLPGWDIAGMLENWNIAPDNIPRIMETVVSITYGDDVIAILPDGGYQAILPMSFEDMAEIVTLCDCSIEWVNI